ncbi:serine/threonine protein kinase (plasmid) [Pontibacillus sp. ALD_SL1]|uniref:serine/threonine protein kinase n=1 Tax=Pontibacillus sp. ALD_SL1 TaxID=2777185 RepID=UPI001A9691AA|nr:serine/threonine protein kinase [Pontibacillus sp. ALD_SL1]QST02222.1 serine/threonine protein kinase [Pontibacillus sp. ALD_SL1]
MNIQWKTTIESWLGESPSGRVTITDRNRIVQTLQTIGESDAPNHLFMPSGGGLDLTGAALSHEEGCMELHFGFITKIVNPLSLTFHPIGEDPEWWYFRLNTKPFQESGVYEEDNHDVSNQTPFQKQTMQNLNYYGEEVLEVSPGEYADRAYWEEKHMGYDEDGREIPLPEGVRVVIRAYNGGDFVVFPKISMYNHGPETYDALHNKMDGDEFESYIEGIVNELAKRE